MRVAHLITRLIVGGAQENTVASVLGLRQQAGVDVRLISGPSLGPEGSLEADLAAAPGLLTTVPDLVRPIHPWKDWRAMRALTAWLRDWRPDLVHTHSGKAGILGRLAARRAGVPIIVHTIHGPSFGPFQGFLANALFTTAERRAGRFTTHFVSVADAMTRQYLAAGIGRPDQYSRVLSGFPLAPFLNAQPDPTLRERLGLKPDDFVVGKIARLFKLKGHADLIAAAPALVARCPRIRFLLMGEGAWRSRFEGAIARRGLTRHFVFTGLVPPAEVPRHVALMDVLVHLSLREGLPRSLPQALAAGKPVIAYDCDGAREICRENETGFLLAPGDRHGLVERILQLERDPPLRRRLGEQGCARVRESFSVEKMVADLQALYLRLLKAAPR
jgi:glycosyltransferase involved in cell wall biosynthesis